MGQKIRADGGDKPNTQLAGQRVARQVCQIDNVVGVANDAPRALHHFFASGRQCHIARLPLHQSDPGIVLELLDLRRQRGLANEAALRRLAEVTGVRKGHEVFQVTQVHGKAPAARYAQPIGSIRTIDWNDNGSSSMMQPLVGHLPSPLARPLWPAGSCIAQRRRGAAGFFWESRASALQMLQASFARRS